MPIVSINNRRIHYEDTGGDGQAVVFSHGFALDHSIWSAQAEALSPEYRCVTYDERGHGMSESNGTFTFWDLASDVIGLLDHLGIERSVLVGHSQGGWLSMRAALQDPARVAGLVLVGTAADLDSPEVTAAYSVWAKTWTTDGPVGELFETMLGVQFGVDAPAHAAEWAAKWRSRPPSSYRDIWTSVIDGRDDVMDRLGEISCPALVVHGTADVAFDMGRARDTASALGNPAGLVEVDGAPHALSVTHPAPVTDAVRALASHVAEQTVAAEV
jgi:pimeloyl-ACP methyl ester carboxylesterase